MIHSPDWKALDALFAPPAAAPHVEPNSAQHEEIVCYLGQMIPKWLARDLMQERAAIYEFSAGMTRAEAEDLARRGL